MVERLVEWVRRKGLGSGHVGNIGVAGTYSTDSRKRTGNKFTQDQQNRQAAYMIARKIMINGIKAQPFFYPAVQNNRDILEKNLTASFG